MLVLLIFVSKIDPRHLILFDLTNTDRTYLCNMTLLLFLLGISVILLDITLWSGPRFNIKMSSYQYRKSHTGEKTVVRSSYLHSGISYTSKMTSLYWIGALSVCGESQLRHWGQDKMAAILQITYSLAFSWMKMYESRLKFHWGLW